MNYTKDANIVAAYLCQTDFGTTLIDSSSNALNGTFSSSGHPAWQTAAPARSYLTYSLNWGTSTDYITLPATGNILAKPGQVQSFVAWLYPLSSSVNTGPRLWDRNNGTSAANFNVGANSIINFSIQGTTNLLSTSSNNSVTLNSWNHVVVTWDGSVTATNVHIYINAVEVSYQTQTNGVSLDDDSTAVVYLGNRSDGARYIDGYMTEIAIFSRVLSQSDVTSIYNYGLLQKTSSNILTLGVG